MNVPDTLYMKIDRDEDDGNHQPQVGGGERTYFETQSDIEQMRVIYGDKVAVYELKYVIEPEIKYKKVDNA